MWMQRLERSSHFKKKKKTTTKIHEDALVNNVWSEIIENTHNRRGGAGACSLPSGTFQEITFSVG
jgi:hypothetical protein